MTNPELVTLAKRIAVQNGLDPAVVCALCEQESAWEPAAIRWEPGFFARYITKQNLTNQTEATARAISWGLMQVMGQVARESGFKGRYLSEMCDPETGITVGCKVFASKLARAGGDLRKALLFWNGGGRPSYADEVLARISKYK